METFNNIDSDNEIALINNFQDMLKDSSEDVREFAIMSLQHIAAHDNFKYVSGSIVRTVRPMYFNSLNKIYKGVGDNPGLEDIFNAVDAETNEPLSLKDFRMALSNFYGESEDDISYMLVNDFVKFYFSDGRNALHLKVKDTAFPDKDNKPKYNKENKTYEITVAEDKSFPQIFKTVKIAAAAPGQRGASTFFIYTIQSVETVKDSKGNKVKRITYEMNRKTKKPTEFTQKYYQFEFNEFIDLLNEGIDLQIAASKNVISKLKIAKAVDETDGDLYYSDDESADEDLDNVNNLKSDTSENEDDAYMLRLPLKFINEL
jgi:hypothetical protein